MFSLRTNKSIEWSESKLHPKKQQQQQQQEEEAKGGEEEGEDTNRHLHTLQGHER
jgi:hypothetical protein